MTTEHPYASWVEDDDRAQRRQAHAVAVTDGVPAPLTLCGETVAGSTDGPFVATVTQIRCRYCADVVGVAHH